MLNFRQRTAIFAVAASFSLEQNYPNPFNLWTTIAYSLGSAMHVRLDVFDLLGRRISTLVDAVRTSDRHEVNFDAGSLPSRMYLCRIAAGDWTYTKVMSIVR